MKALDDILLVSAHDRAADLRVIRLGPEVPRVRGVAAVFEGNKVVFLVAGHVVGMRNAPGGIDLSRVRVDELRPCLMDSVPVFPKLLPLQLARVFRRGPDQLRAPVAVAYGVPDVLLRDLRVRSARTSSRGRGRFQRGRCGGFERGNTDMSTLIPAAGMAEGIRAFIA